MDNPMNDTINSIKDFKEKLEKAAGQTEEVKNGTMTEEEEKNEPAYVLYNAIAESSVQLMQLPAVQVAFTDIAEKLGGESAKKIIEMLVLLMTLSAHNAVTFYDKLLKQELSKQFDAYGKPLNDCIATVNGLESAMKVFRQSLSDIEKEMKISKLKEK